MSTLSPHVFVNRPRLQNKRSVPYLFFFRNIPTFRIRIPLEAYEYVVNGRSAIEWIMERYQVKIDKDSGIKNDPNDWAVEHGKPRDILDLLLSIVTVSLETRKIVNALPKPDFQAVRTD